MEISLDESFIKQAVLKHLADSLGITNKSITNMVFDTEHSRIDVTLVDNTTNSKTTLYVPYDKIKLKDL